MNWVKCVNFWGGKAYSLLFTCSLARSLDTTDAEFGPLPTYPLVLGLKGNDYDVNVFAKASQGEPLPGMPPYDPNKIVHGEQSLEIFNPFPVHGGTFDLQKTCTGVYDKGKRRDGPKEGQVTQ